MEKSKNELIGTLNKLKNNLKNLIYPDYPDLKIYSKEYYHNIFLNFFSNTNKTFSFMYGDFNKIKKINDTFGNTTGDIVLETGFKLVRESFPDEAYISRIGGDEITVISPNLNKKQTLHYINNLNNKLDNLSQNINDIHIYINEGNTNCNNNLCYLNANVQNLQKIEQIYGKEAFNKTLDNINTFLNDSFSKNATITKIDNFKFNIITNQSLTEEEIKQYENQINNKLKDLVSLLTISITTSVLDSTTADIRKLEYLTDQDVSEQKNLRALEQLNKNENDPWKTLNMFITIAIENHLSDIRPSDKFIYDIADYKKEVFFMIDTFIDSLEKNIYNIDNVNNNSDLFNFNEETFPNEEGLTADSELVSLVHSFLTTNDVSLENVNTEKLLQMDVFMSTLLDYLTHNKHSGELNKFYFKHYLAKEICEKNSNLQLVIISMMDIKANNTAYGHNATDERILKTTKLVKDLYNDRNFNNESFVFSENNSYFIDFNGGELVMLFDKNQITNIYELEKKLQLINNTYNPENPNSPLPVVGTISDSIPTDNVNNLLHFIKDLKQSCSYKKDKIKKETFDSVTKRISFQKSIDIPIKYYLKNIPNSSDIEQKKKFISMVFHNLLEHEANHNLKSRDTFCNISKS